MLNFKKIKEKGISFRLFWDLFVISIVFPNLFLILFDLTYLYFRPQYSIHFPEVIKLYDPILGIESHRTTEEYLKLTGELEKLNSYKEPQVLNKEIELQFQDLLESYKKIEIENSQELKNNISEISKLSSEQKYSQIDPINLKMDLVLKSNLDLNEYSEISKQINNFSLLIRASTQVGLEEEIEKVLQKMDQQMVYIVEENPFQESGQTHIFKKIQKIIKDNYSKLAKPLEDEYYKKLLNDQHFTRKKVSSTAIAFSYFWRNKNNQFSEKLDFFNKQLRPLIKLNYYRTTDLSGALTNNFFYLDVPFFLFFIIEFNVRWYLAIVRKKYIAWFLYPLYHWYDLLGLIPLQGFHFFRIFRAYTIYQILKESEFTTIGNDIITRTVTYYSNIIKEEISDMVTIQILTDTQEEIRSGSSIEVLTEAINSHRPEIKSLVISRLASPKSLKNVENLIGIAIQTSLYNDKSVLKNIPFINQESLIKNMLLSPLNSFQLISKEMVESEVGRLAIEKIIDLVLDEIVENAKSEDLNRLNQDITIDLIENVKKQVLQKKWVNSKI
jgi:hypothetical protein